MAEVLVASDNDAEEARSAQTAALRLVDLTRKVVSCQRASIHAIEGPDELMRPVAVVGMPAEMEHAWWEEWMQRPRLADVLDADTLARLRGGEVSIFDLTQPPNRAYSNPYQIVTLLVAPMRLGDRLVGILALDHDHARHEYSADEIALAVAVAKLAAVVIEREHLLEQREAARASALALREANHHMDDFLSMASHELRNPLTSIRASIQLAERRIKKLAEPPAAALTAEAFARLLDPLQRGERQTGLLDRLVGDLLDVSRIQTNRLELRMAEVDLASLARDIVEQHSFAHPEHAISLTLPERPAVLVRADPDRISQVITNYLTNALKYSPADRPIAVSLDVTEHQARLRVRDQGPGLPPAERSRIWERFHRAPGITASSGKSGLGLGLFISRGFIERHGGQVGVESEFGQGSTFWFTLPLAPTP
jgi:signal transduction histidine kinase